jgi:hypothetical protein
LLTTSIKRVSAEGDPGQISIYPNPPGGSIYIYFNKEESRSISMMDLKGSEIFSIESYDRQVSIPAMNLSKGLYIIKVQSASGLFSKKLILDY